MELIGSLFRTTQNELFIRKEYHRAREITYINDV